MAALFLLALVLIGWQAVRTKPMALPSLSFGWRGGEQVFPIAAPFWVDPVALPAERLERYKVLRRHSVPWPNIGATAATDATAANTADGACESFIRTSSSAWVRRGIDPGLLPPAAGGGETLRYAAKDFLDDDDGDGDALDAGELIPGGSGAEVELFCPPPTGGEALP